MNENEKIDSAIDASCRVPLLALFGGAALWLMVGLLFSLIASLNFHMPEKFGDCAWLTYGRIQPAANDAILYGFCIPAALGVILWIFARLSETELFLPLVPIIAANIWHLGVFIGIAAVLMGDSTGFTWLEFPRGSSVLLFTAFLLIAVSAMATFGARRERTLQPSHWFLLAAVFWFPWIYSTANLFLLAHHPVRGVTQAVIDWWFSNNLIFIWLALVGIGTAFYFLPKFVGRALHNNQFASFAFITLILFGTWCGIPQGAPVPAWLPTLSSVGTALLIMPLLAIAIVEWRTVWGSVKSKWDNSSFCFIGAGADCFILSGLMLILMACPRMSHLIEFTWFGPAQFYLQILGFASMTLFGAIYYLLPRVVGIEFPFPKIVRAHFWISLIGVTLLVLPLAIGGFAQGLKGYDFETALPFLRVSTTGLLFLLLGSLMFAANIFVMTFKWKIALLKSLVTAVKAPLETASASVSLRRDHAVAEGEGGEVKS